MDTLARAPGGQMRGAATKAMSDIVEERQQKPIRALAAAPLWAAARRLRGAGSRWLRGAVSRWLWCSLLTYRPGYSSSLDASPAGLGASSKCPYYFFTDPYWLSVRWQRRRMTGRTSRRRYATRFIGNPAEETH